MKKLLLIFLIMFSGIADSQVSVIRGINIIPSASMATNITSAPVHVIYLENIGIQYVWTGSPTGTIGVSVSNQTIAGSNPPAPMAGSFTALNLTTLNPPIVNPSGSSGQFFLDVNQTGAEWVEVTYTASGGTGTLNAYLTAKGI